MQPATTLSKAHHQHIVLVDLLLAPSSPTTALLQFLLLSTWLFFGRSWSNLTCGKSEDEASNKIEGAHLKRFVTSGTSSAL